MTYIIVVFGELILFHKQSHSGITFVDILYVHKYHKHNSLIMLIVLMGSVVMTLFHFLYNWFCYYLFFCWLAWLCYCQFNQSFQRNKFFVFPFSISAISTVIFISLRMKLLLFLQFPSMETYMTDFRGFYFSNISI